MKKILLIIAATAFTFNVYALNKTDSLINLLNTTSNKKKLEILLKLENYYAPSKFDSALYFGNRAIELSEQLKKPLIKASAIKTKGNIYFRKGKLDSALMQYNKAIEIYKNNNNEFEAAKIYNNKGLLYMNWGNQTKALQNLQNALLIYKNSENELLTTGPLTNMGLIHFRSGNYKNAEQLFKKALLIAENYNDIRIITNITNNLGAVYKEWGQYANALDFYNQSVNNFKILDDKYGESIAYYNIGVVYEELGNYSKAVEYILNSLKIKRKINSKIKIPVSLNKLGNIYCQWEKYELALNYYADALKMGNKNNDKLVIANSLSGMAQVYIKTDIYTKSLDYYSEAIKIYEEINSKKEIAEINNEIGDIYSEKLNQYSKADEYFKIAEHIYKQLESNNGLASLYLSRGKSFYLQNLYTKAIANIKKSIELMPFNNYKMFNKYILLAQCYSPIKQYNNAIDAYKMALVYKDSIIYDKTKLQLAKFEVKYKIEKKEQEIRNLQQQSQLNTLLLNKKRNMQILLILLVFLLLIIVGLILLFYKKLHTVNKQLVQKQIKIETSKKDLENTNLKLSESNIETERISKYKSLFLANISHEIRTPLNAILGYAKLLSKNIIDDSNQYYLNQVLQATDNMMIVINDLLDFSKIEAGKMVIEQTNFNPVKIVTEAISTLKFRAEEKKIKLEIHIDPLIPETLNGDPYRLSQILTNLISNAIKFSNNEQIVTIEAKCENHSNKCSMHFNITDNGLGIPENKLETIFESFSQAHSDTSRLHSGAGLGLSIVKRLVELQNGSISVKSKIKEGSVFSFTIPYKITQPDDNKTQNNKTDKTESTLTSNYSILLVEDNLINQELAKDTILSWPEHFTVDIAENGKEAIIALQNKEFDLVLMDIQMPIMDGHEATQYIRSSLPAPKCKIPIIGMTAHALSSEKEQAIKNGMNEYIIKPFNPDELKQKIVYFVTHKE